LRERFLLNFLHFFVLYIFFIQLMPTWLCIESCGFVNEEFPAEIQKFAKEQQVLVYAKYSNLPYTVLANVF
jgi:hypothetical protein